MGLLVISLQSAGNQIGWGFQFQQPAFLMFMSVLVLLFALSLFGLFDVSLNSAQGAVNRLADKEGYVSDFFKGVLATILSTPCTAPFLGTALGFAFVQPWHIILTIFAAVGFGMCLPYFLLLLNPQYVKLLPRPGAWMEKLKEAFGFVLLATAIWLLSILFDQISIEQVIHFSYFLLVVSFIVWLNSRFAGLSATSNRIKLIRLLSLIIIVGAYIFLNQKSDDFTSTNAGNHAEEYISGAATIEKLNQAIKAGKTVFLDCTAKWCLTCHVNESLAINTDAFRAKMRSLNAVIIKADWTKQDADIAKLLKKFGRSGVPLYVIFPAKNPNQPIILPELVTQQLILDKLDEAGPSKSRSSE